MKNILKDILRAMAIVGVFIAGYCLGYHRRGNLYTRSVEVQVQLDRLLDRLAISAITYSRVGRKYADVEINRLLTVYSTNELSK